MTNVHQLRPQGKPGQPLPPLHDRRTRTQLLASSYLLACPSGNDRDIHITGKPQSRSLNHSEDLWPYGSYQELERAMDDLRRHDRHLSFHFWRTHVSGQRSEVASERDTATHALGWVAKRMPPSIHVPLAVSTGAGYLLGEAKAYATRWELRGEEAS